MIRSPRAMGISKGLRADIALILITIIWGSSFTLVKKSLAQASPITFIALRFWIATAVTIACMPRSLLNIPRDTFWRGVTLSVLLLGGFVFQTLGLRGTTASRSAFITSMSVLLVPVLGYVLFGRRPRPQTLAGVMLATGGLGFLTLERLELAFSYGDLLTFLCAIVFALHILCLGRYLPMCDFRQLLILQMAGSAILCTLLLPLLESPFLAWDLTFTLYVAVVGVLSTGVAFYAQTWAQRFTTPNRTALIFSLEPFFAAVFAYVMLGDRLTVKEWVGGTLVIAGIVTAEFRRTSGGVR
ncbi:MAG: DMT family transporter [Acidobacteria bacterium]|nr:DMT family transporter [Acidobacteriota bacterium]